MNYTIQPFANPRTGTTLYCSDALEEFFVLATEPSPLVKVTERLIADVFQPLRSRQPIEDLLPRLISHIHNRHTNSRSEPCESVDQIKTGRKIVTTP